MRKMFRTRGIIRIHEVVRCGGGADWAGADRRSPAFQSERIAKALTVVLVCSLVRCRTGEPVVSPEPERTQFPPVSVDPTRAYLTLDQIQPAIQAPPAVTIRPLSSRGREQLEKAVALEAEQRYSEALDELQRGLGFDPRHPLLLSAQARLYFRSGSTERARAAAAAAIQADPSNADVHVLLGQMYLADGQLEEALSALRSAVAASGGKIDERPLLYYLLGDVLDRLGYLTAALKQFERVDETWHRGGKVEADLSALIRIDGGHPTIRRADILDRLGRPTEAAALLERHITSGKATESDRLRCARLLLKANRAEEALRFALAIPNPDDTAVSLLSDIRKAQGREEALVDDLRALLTASPGNTGLALALADAAERLDRRAEGIDGLRAFLERHPRDVVVRERLVRMLIAGKRFGDVVPVCARAVDDEPALVWTMLDRMNDLSRDDEASRLILDTVESTTLTEAILKAELALARHDPGRVAMELDRFAGQTATSLPARYILARARLKQFDWAGAQAVAKRQEADTAEDARLEWVLAEAAVGLDDPQLAELHYKAAIQLHRTDERSMLGLARVYSDSGRALQAEKQLRTLLELNPRHGEAREALINLYLNANRLDEVSRQLQELDRQQPGSCVLARCLAEVQRRQGVEPSAYRAMLQEAIGRNGPDSLTLLALGDAQVTEGDLEAARATYEQALRLDPYDDDAMVRLIGVDELALDFESAHQRLTNLLSWFPNRHGLRLELIHVLTVLGRFDEALDVALTAESSSNLSDAARTAYRERALDILDVTRRDDERLALLARYAEDEGGGGTWTRRHIEALIDLNRAEEAVAVARRAFEASKERIDGEQVVNALIAMGRADRALQMILDWQEEDPDNEAIVGLLASKLVLCEKYDEALNLLRNQLLWTSNPERVRERIFRTQRAAGRHAENIRFLEDWISELGRLSEREFARSGTIPDRIQAGLDELVQLLHSWIVQEMMLDRQWSAAQARIQQLLATTTDPVRQFDLLVLSYNGHQFAGDETESLAVLERCHRIKPKDVGTCNDLGYLLAERGERLEEAEKLARFAVGRAPRNMAYLDTLGWVLYKKGRFEDAYLWLKRASRAERREDADVLEHLGDAAWRLGRKEEAVQYWKNALALTGKSEDEDRRSRMTAERIEQKVEAGKNGREPAIAPVGAGASR